MLEITISEKELFQEHTLKFIQIPECKLTLEHSLISLAKWESKWNIPFFDGKPKTPAQDLDYIRCMVVGNIKDDRIFDHLSRDEILQIQNYMAAPMTATTFSASPNQRTKPRKEVMTAETIYARMCAHNISFECQKWHLNRLLTLIRVCDLRDAPRDKMSKKETQSWINQQNAARRAKYGTRG